MVPPTLGLEGTEPSMGLESREGRDTGRWAECREEGRFQLDLEERVGSGKVDSEGVRALPPGSLQAHAQRVKGTWACGRMGLDG